MAGYFFEIAQLVWKPKNHGLPVHGRTTSLMCGQLRRPKPLPSAGPVSPLLALAKLLQLDYMLRLLGDIPNDGDARYLYCRQLSDLLG